MKIQSLPELLANKTYPGRGIMLGKSADGKKGMLVYFIMGRSENSRNRIFVTEGDGIRTQAYDPDKLTDPSLIIYAPVRVLGNKTIVTNGDQTDTIYEGLNQQLSFEQSLRRRTFEPDGPNFTPRISGVMKQGEGDCNYALSILKSAEGDPAAAHQFTFAYKPALAGQGHFISTYADDGDPLPSFEGEPIKVYVPEDIESFAEEIWSSLNNENKVSLFIRSIDLIGGETSTKIFNVHQQ